MQQNDAQEQWDLLNMWIELVPNYPLFNLDRHSMRFDFLDGILSTLLYINLVSFLDERLEVFIGEQGISCPKDKYRPNLGGRLLCLKEHDRLNNFDELWRVRSRRNEFGHTLDQVASWRN